MDTTRFFHRSTVRFMYFFMSVFTSYIAVGGAVAAPDTWMVDTRATSWTQADESRFEKLRYYRQIEGRWVRSDAKTFFGTQDPAKPLVVLTPGYTSTTEDLMEAGGALLSRMRHRENECRTVFWDWPSEKNACCLAQDIRSRIPVAHANGDYMAMFLRRLKPWSRVCLLAFSFGNRIVCDAVEDLGDDRPEGIEINLVLMAAAVDQNALGNRGRNANVPRLSNRILVLYNPEDFRLQFYPMLYGGNYRPEALGRYGPPLRSIDGAYHDRIEAVNTHRSLGKRHLTLLYLKTPEFRNRIGKYLFFDRE